MPLFKLSFKPGIDNQNTEYGAEGGWIDADYVRFREGLPEKMGGWTAFQDQVKPTDTTQQALFIGSVTAIHTWNDLAGAPYAIIGTDRKLYAYYGGFWGDITPVRNELAFRGWGVGGWNQNAWPGDQVTFNTVSGSTTLVVNDEDHGALVGDFLNLSNVNGTPGNIPNDDLVGEYEIQRVVDNDSFEILSPTTATSTSTVTGSADCTYQINVGLTDGAVGSWSLNTWNTPRPQTDNSVSIYPRVWQFDNFGEDVICQVVDGEAYLFDTSDGVNARATLIENAPTKSTFSIVSPVDRHLIMFGTEVTIGDKSTQDPMLVRFSDQENINVFTPSSINTAGDMRLNDGSKIVSAVRSRGQILIFTDISLHGMQYVGPPYTFAFQQLGSNCGCIGPHAAIDVNGQAFWMGQDNFHAFDGAVRRLRSTVEDYVFNDINKSQTYKVHAGHNSQFNEVTWWYCSNDSKNIDRWVSYNYVENIWSRGTMPRTAWTDKGTFRKPMAGEYFPDSTADTYTTISGLSSGRSLLYNQEDGLNGNGSAINSYLQSGYFDIGDGEQVMFMRRFIPDFKDQQNNLTVQLILRMYPNAEATISSSDLHTVTPTTEKVDTRARGRQISLKIQSQSADTTWRFGTLRVHTQPDGLR